jgi:glutamate formiminotransferase
MSVILTKNATEITIKDPVYPYKTEQIESQVEFSTEGGTQIIEELGEADEVRVYIFKHLTAAEKADLESFRKNTIEGMLNTFTFNDGTPVTVRWVDPKFDPTLETYNSYTVIMRLRVVS